MREHEVPTHVQAEDKVLLWFTFPQIVAITAVCALSYGAYRYAPVGPSEARMALAILFGLTGCSRWEDRRSAVAAGGCRPVEVPAGSPPLHRAGVPAGEERTARARPAGAERFRPAAVDSQEIAPSPPQTAKEEARGERRPRRENALPSPQLVRQALRAQERRQ